MGMVLGLDLNDKVTQLSYMESDAMQPETLSAVAGGDEYEIPTVLARRENDNAWVFGKEAVNLSKSLNAPLLDGLYSRALDGSMVYVGEDEYEAVDMLILFIRRVLSITALIGQWQSAERLVICVEELNEISLKLLEKVVEGIDFPRQKVDFISKAESFYEYTIHQREELWQRDVVIFDYSDELMTVRSFSVDRTTKPAVCRIEDKKGIDIDTSNDEEFMNLCQEILEGRIVTSVYLIGDRKPEDTLKQTLRYLCMKRRVFQGGNLYTKGACYAAWDREHESDLTKAFLFLGRDRLKSNIGLRLVRNREEVYEPLVDAGVNWYDVHEQREFYLGKERELRLLLTPLTGKNEHYAIVRLADFPARGERLTRVRLEASMIADDILRVKVRDLGFGDIFPATDRVITEDINLQSEI